MQRQVVIGAIVQRKVFAFAGIDLSADVVAVVSWLRVSGDASHHFRLSYLIVLIHISSSVSRNKWAIGFCVSAVILVFQALF